MPLFAPCNAGAISSAAIAISCIVVFHFASRVTGTLTRSSARNSRRPETKISRIRTMIAAQIDQPSRTAVGDEDQDGDRDEQLVGDRVEHAAERRLLLPGARQIAVEIVGDAGDHEDHEGDPGAPVVGDIVGEPDQRRRGDAAVGQDIREGSARRNSIGRRMGSSTWTVMSAPWNSAALASIRRLGNA